MPIYEYQCEECGKSFELLIRRAEQPECPDCHSRELRKEFSVVAAHSRSSSDGCELPACQGGSCAMPPCQDGSCGF